MITSTYLGPSPDGDDRSLVRCDGCGTELDAEPTNPSYGGWVVTWWAYCPTCEVQVEVEHDHYEGP